MNHFLQTCKSLDCKQGQFIENPADLLHIAK
jgi:hypothetical protein